MPPVVPPPVPLIPATVQKHVDRSRVLLTVLSCVAGGAISFFTTWASLSMQVSSFATETEVDAKIAIHDARPRAHGTDWTQSPHPPYAQSAAKAEALEMKIGDLLENQEADADGTFLMLGRLQVADCERNAKLKMQRANKFETDYAELLAREVPARKAAEQLVRTACPWMSR